MFKILPRITGTSKSNMPQRTVTITRKNGRDVIKDEFIGFYVKRPSILEVIRDLFTNLY